MSSSLIVFLTVLEEELRAVWPAAEGWRVQRLIDFGAEEATLQVWDGEKLCGQAEVKRTKPAEGAVTMAGVVQGGAARKGFSFRPGGEEDNARQARVVAEMWAALLV